MLNTQLYLSTKTLTDLTNELHIVVNKHDSLPLAILNYDQLDSPKTHPIVRECRGLVLNTENNSLVAKSFHRFYNWGEVADEMPLFNWNKAFATEKIDGSLILIYYFNNQWHVNTRGSFGFGPMFNTEWEAKYHNMPREWTWHQGILNALNVNNLNELNLDPKLTYVGEFVSPWNKVVREYKTPKVYLLTRFDGEMEIGPAPTNNFLLPEIYQLNSADDIINFVNNYPESTYEGMVAQDNEFRRWKIKNARYIALHRMKGNGEALYDPKNLIPYILSGDDEILVYYPEVTECYNEIKTKVNKAYDDLKDIWEDNWQIDNQKDFAVSIVGKTPFTGILFTQRKELGKNQSLDTLRKAWRENADGIVKTLFKNA